ncbi:nitroreductase family protein [Oscillibacter sp.]|uniref:nitroreductase family protein n=3 Tax=unclassified Oscillibacter TaxID=2629304 RepID=UPI00289782D2|nr:nitroreductase family protein [Oscillibacter sp.]
MDYSAMIQNRKSVREFQDTKVPDATLAEINEYYESKCGRLVPSIGTELRLFGSDFREKLKGAAGYNDFMIGNADYFAILSDEAEYMAQNAGFIAEDLILHMTELNLGTCWLTFKDGEAVKKALGIESDRRVVVLAAFGVEKKAAKRLFLNIQNISKVDAVKREFYSPRLGIESLVYSGKWGNKAGVDEEIGDMDHPLWQALYAASLAPSYLNRQPYGFVLDGGAVVLISKDDGYTDENEQKLNLGIVMLHFAAVAEQTLGKRTWTLGAYDKDLGLPSGYRAVASCKL